MLFLSNSKNKIFIYGSRPFYVVIQMAPFSLSSPSPSHTATPECTFAWSKQLTDLLNYQMANIQLTKRLNNLKFKHKVNKKRYDDL